jgi:uncharacterized membrane protein YccC
MIKIVSLIILITVSIVVNIGGWVFSKKYCQTAVDYLSKRPAIDFIIHVFTGLGFGWLTSLYIPRAIVQVLGIIIIVIIVIIQFVVPKERIPEHLTSVGMGCGLPVGIGIAWLSNPWLPDILILILGAISFIGAETVHYVIPNIVA